jgi:hypothetical protein
MTTRLLSLAIAATLAAAGCDPAAEAPPPAPAAPAVPGAAAVPAPGGPGRTLSNDARAAMKEALGGEAGPRKAWIYSQPGNAEVAALVASLQGVFREAGWEVAADTASGISLKPGVVTLVAEEEYPPYVERVLKALEASALGAKSAAGYRAYAQEMKDKNPNWPGVPIRAEQDFVIVVGPKPPA